MEQTREQLKAFLSELQIIFTDMQKDGTLYLFCAKTKKVYQIVQDIISDLSRQAVQRDVEAIRAYTDSGLPVEQAVMLYMQSKNGARQLALDITSSIQRSLEHIGRMTECHS